LQRSFEAVRSRCNPVATRRESLTSVDADLLTEVIARAPVDVEEAYSGSRIERLWLSGGRVVVLKHLPAEGDWLTRATAGLGRAQLLWHSGLLRRLEPAVEHGTCGVVAFDDHDALVMEDLAERLWPHSMPLTLSHARVALAGLVDVHDLGARLVASGNVNELDLCSVGQRYGMFAPATHAADDGPHPHPGRDRIVKGWDFFFATVDADVAQAVAAVHADPHALGRKISARGTSATVLHGDAKPENLGVTGGRLTAIDWGELTGLGPREVDVAWFALMSTRSRLDAEPDELFALYEKLSGRTLDPVIVDLACVGSLAQMGFRFAGPAHLAEERAVRHGAAARLRWWVDRVRAALDRGNAP
jgi:hypothetical protein